MVEKLSQFKKDSVIWNKEAKSAGFIGFIEDEAANCEAVTIFFTLLLKLGIFTDTLSEHKTALQ